MDRPPFRPSEKKPDTAAPATQQVLCQGDQREAFALSISSVMVHADDLLGRPRGPAR